MKDYKELQIKLCEDFIKEFFAEHCMPNGGVETNCFFNEAEKNGLWVRGTYGTSISKALERITAVEPVYNNNYEYLYSVFKLK